MDCRRARAALSERMDGDRLSPRLSAAVDHHVETCPACRSFSRSAWKLREAARFQVVGDVPDLVGSIMTAVALQERAPAGPWPDRPARIVPARPAARQPRWPRTARRLAPLAAALVVGGLVGSLVVGGPWRHGGAPPIAAAAVVRGVNGAAPHLDAYQARFAITEYGVPGIGVGEFGMNVWFRAPERFRLDVSDHTQYPPGSAEVRNDISLVVNGSRSSLAGPSGCPGGLGLACPPTRTLVRDRVPFSSGAPMPTDIVLPLDTLSSAHAITVLGTGTDLGRPAVRVQMLFRDAGSLFPFLRLGGRWRPFYPNDRVVLWLDARSWLPLRSEVFPASGAARRDWAIRFGLSPTERPTKPILDVQALSVSLNAPGPGTFTIPKAPPTTTEGAVPVSFADLAARAGYEPLTPSRVDGLNPYRAVLTPAATGGPPGTVVTYATGLSWLKVGQQPGWTGGALFGVDPLAEKVELPGGGVGYYEPAVGGAGRRLAVHAADTDLYLETDLPRAELLAIAASLPVRGEPIPAAWRASHAPGATVSRVSLASAPARLSFALRLPARLPAGYGRTATELVTVDGRLGVNVYFRQTASDLGGGTIRLHEEEASALPPASSATQSTVEVMGVPGRWVPARHQLEWVLGGVYYSLDAPGMGLADLYAVAGSIRPTEAGAAR